MSAGGNPEVPNSSLSQRPASSSGQLSFQPGLTSQPSVPRTQVCVLGSNSTKHWIHHELFNPNLQRFSSTGCKADAECALRFAAADKCTPAVSEAGRTDWAASNFQAGGRSADR